MAVNLQPLAKPKALAMPAAPGAIAPPAMQPIAPPPPPKAMAAPLPGAASATTVGMPAKAPPVARAAAPPPVPDRIARLPIDVFGRPKAMPIGVPLQAGVCFAAISRSKDDVKMVASQCKLYLDEFKTADTGQLLKDSREARHERPERHHRPVRRGHGEHGDEKQSCSASDGWGHGQKASSKYSQLFGDHVYWGVKFDLQIGAGFTQHPNYIQQDSCRWFAMVISTRIARPCFWKPPHEIGVQHARIRVNFTA